ncbi:unnamed protein product [Gadus morhua 'NCC']
MATTCALMKPFRDRVAEWRWPRTSSLPVDAAPRAEGLYELNMDGRHARGLRKSRHGPRSLDGIPRL